MGKQHLTLSQRYKIEALRKAGHSQTAIAEQIGVHKATVSREIKRNACPDGAYKPEIAHRRAQARRKDKGPHKLKGALETHVNDRLAQQWSPEQIARTLPEELGTISHEAIYRHVHKDAKRGGALHQNLRWGRKKRRKRLAKKDMRGRIKNAASIDERPPEVREKTRTGDWEADLVALGGHSGHLLTLVERRTKFLLTALLHDKRADTVAAAIIDRLGRTSLPVRTVTYDNGKEFAAHQRVNKALKCQSFFCHPYSSWERGLNENTNGLLRQYVPKGQTLAQTTWQDLRTATNKLNDRPRKTLDWKTPREFSKEVLRI